MKKLIFPILLSFWSMLSEAQDPLLFSGNSKIILYSDKVISPVRLWKLDSVKSEYVYKGNLTEILTSEISKIVTLNYEITFEKPFKQKLRYYDLIIVSIGDTLRGFITKIDPRVIQYTLPGSKKKKYSYYKSYILNNPIQGSMNYKTITSPKGDLTFESETKTLPDSNSSSKPEISETRSDTSEWAIIYFTETPDRKLNNDIIIKTNGDVIWCTINKQTDMAIYYHIARYGSDPDFNLNMTAVKKVVNNPNGPFENFESLKNTRYSEILLKENNINPDRIYTIDGNSISCNILSISEYEIYYHISMSGKDPRVKIPRTLVKRYEKGITNQDIKPKVKRGTKTFLVIAGGVILTYVVLFGVLLISY